MSKPVVVITIDTEEDNWGDYTCRSPATTNVRRLPEFQQLCDRYNAVPTYLVNWPVTTDPVSADIMRDLATHSRCDVGTHIHPWNTPPVDEQPGPFNSMLANLPLDAVRQKLVTLHSAIQHKIEVTPITFRAGRWGFSADAAGVLVDLGYEVDSSVSPYIDWTAEHGPDYRRAPHQVYRFEPDRPFVPVPAGRLTEVPVSVGFLGGRPQFGLRVREWAMRPTPRRLRMVGVVDRLGIATLRWLSPEVSSARDLVKLATALVRTGANFLNFTFHSPALSPGLTPFVRGERDLREFNDRIEEFLAFAKDEGYRFARLSQLPRLLP